MPEDGANTAIVSRLIVLGREEGLVEHLVHIRKSQYPTRSTMQNHYGAVIFEISLYRSGDKESVDLLRIVGIHFRRARVLPLTPLHLPIDRIELLASARAFVCSKRPRSLPHTCALEWILASVHPFIELLAVLLFFVV
jgi:hypothetical protein